MKSILMSFALVMGLAQAAIAAPQIGEPAPAFTGINTKGETISLSDYAGQKVVLEWTNHDCPFVVKHYGSGNMQRTQATLTEGGYAWLTIISSAPGKQGHVSPAKADELTASRGAYTDHVILDPDGTIGHAYEAKTTPHMFIIDEQQVLQYMGAIDSIRSARQSDIPKATNYVLAAHQAIESGEPVTETSTRAYGCSVKYK
jgi:alkyl hydroperoxide reductase subunit AhpC